MKQQSKPYLLASGLSLLTFGVWTLLVLHADRQPIGPNGSYVGLAAFNQWVHQLTGVHFSLYTITDWLGLVPVGVGFAFALLGLIQWIGRKRLSLVDKSLFWLGGFYLATLSAYLLFETIVINYRPVLINGFLEVSYPSSTTLLVLCIMPTALLQLRQRITHSGLRRFVLWSIGLFTAFMVAGRLISGVHWITDIIGGILLSAALVLLYAGLTVHTKK